jgi:repressor LexA
MAVQRPTKKQRELLDFIAEFTSEHGYSPSYREIMNSLGYKSVATVAAHINNLIARGHLVKRDKSARSLELVEITEESMPVTLNKNPSHEKWLVERLNQRFDNYGKQPNKDLLNEIYVLTGALSVLGFEEAASSAKSRLSNLKK